MSMAIAHFALGAGITTLVVLVCMPTVWFSRTLSLLGGGWAMVPDAHWISPIAHQRLSALEVSAWADLFWFHRLLDQLDPTNSKAVAAACIAFFIVATACTEFRKARTPVPVETTYDVTPNEKAFRE